MELHALDRELAVAQAHHQPVLGLGGDLEHVGHRVAGDDERVVARRGERVRQPGEHAGVRVADLRRLAVHHVRRAHDRAAVQLADALQAEAHAEHGDAPLAEVPDRGVREPGVGRAARAGRDEHRVGPERVHLVERHRVVAVHDRLRAQLTEVLHEVVDERVVVVDDEHSRAHAAQGSGGDDRSTCRVMPQSKSKRSRYTPPPPAKAPPSPLWVPVVMATTLACGLIVIVGNYLELLPGRHVEPLPDARPAAHRLRLPARHDVPLTARLNRESRAR